MCLVMGEESHVVFMYRAKEKKVKSILVKS